MQICHFNFLRPSLIFSLKTNEIKVVEKSNKQHTALARLGKVKVLKALQSMTLNRKVLYTPTSTLQSDNRSLW